MSLLVAGLLFFILSPGILLTIPAGSRGLFVSGQTSVAAAAVHAVVFVAVSYLLMSIGEKFMDMPGGPGGGTPCPENKPCTAMGKPGFCQNGKCMGK